MDIDSLYSAIMNDNGDYAIHPIHSPFLGRHITYLRQQPATNIPTDDRSYAAFPIATTALSKARSVPLHPIDPIHTIDHRSRCHFVQ
eukprot:scaffold227952_cov70-Cyclotella_meneghiniana.AAC.3